MSNDTTTTNGPTVPTLSMAYKRIAQLEAELAAAGVALREQYDIAADAIARLNDSTRKASDLTDELTATRASAAAWKRAATAHRARQLFISLYDDSPRIERLAKIITKSEARYPHAAEAMKRR